MAKPRTYMNRSGEAVGDLLAGLGRTPGDLLLVYDDLDLPLGRIRIRPAGSAGGHRGVASVLRVLGTEEILRVRMGIGRQPMPGDRKDFVLSDFLPEEEAELNGMIKKAGDAVTSILIDGVSKSMTMFNA